MVDTETIGVAVGISYAAVEIGTAAYNIIAARYVNWRYKNQSADQRARHLEARLVSFGPASAAVKITECTNVEYDWIHWESEDSLSRLFRKNR